MKTTLIPALEMSVPELSYPVLMNAVGSLGFVVLFIGPQEGYRISGPAAGQWEKGFIRATDKNHWQRFKGQVTLEND